MLLRQDAVVGDEAFFACAAVLGGYKGAADFSKLFELQQVLCRAAAEQESRLATLLAQLFAIVEQGRSAHAAAYQQDFRTGGVVETETIAEGKHEVHGIAGLLLGKRRRAVAHDVHEQPEFASCTVYVVNGNGAAQKSRARLFHFHLDKLPRPHLGQRLSVGGGEFHQEIICPQELHAAHKQVADIFLHKKTMVV